MDEFAALGASLKQAREDQELSLDELARRTRIRRRYLEAMETGDFDAIRSPIQLRGFLRNYAHAVGLDGEMVVAHYDQLKDGNGQRRKRRSRQAEVPAAESALDLKQPPPGYQPAPSATGPQAAVDSSGQAAPSGLGRMWRGLRWVLILGGAAALAALVVGGILLGIGEVTDQSNATAPPPLLEMNEIDGMDDDGLGQDDLPTLEPTPTLIEVQAPDSSTPSFEGASQLFISLTAEERVWVLVKTDGTEAFRGLLVPGSGVQYNANESITVRTTNAGGLRIRINNQDYQLGTGRVTAQQTFTLEGLINPTPTPSPPPTATSSVTATFTLAASLTATLTDTATPPDAAGAALSPTNTFFFTPEASPVDGSGATDDGGPTPLPSPVQFTATPSLTATLTLPPATDTPTVTPSPTLTPTLTPSLTFTPSPSPTTPSTPTPFLPPRATRTPRPEK